MPENAPRLLLVPPDTRPPTLAFPAGLARACGLELRLPPPAALNRRNLPGEHAQLRGWLEQEGQAADLLILSLEMLCLGGMIPARRVTDPLTQALERLGVLPELKQRYPALRIYAFGVIVRVAHDNDPLEEKPYYGEHGEALRAYSHALDAYERHGLLKDKQALGAALNSLPPEVLQDWLAARQRNHALHHRALELLREGVLEHLCLTLDDTSAYGLAARDRRALEQRVDALGLWDKVDIYPGADEVPLTLLARAVQAQPTRVFVRYASTLGAAAQLIYEDRPAGELVKAHVRAAGGVLVDSLAEAELVLAVNTPGVGQAQAQPDVAVVDTTARHLPDFVDAIVRLQAAGKPVAIADIAYPNGAERRLMTLLAPRVSLAGLAGYSAWNTAGNTIGSALAMGILFAFVQDERLWLQELFGRFVDDYLYQAVVREQLRSALQDPSPFDLGEALPEAERLLESAMHPLALAFWERHFARRGYALVWRRASLAWPRLFTGVFDFELKRRADPSLGREGGG